MWTIDRLNPRDAYEPTDREIARDLATTYAAGDAIDTTDSALRCIDFDPFILASLRTPADEAAAEAALESALAVPADSAEVVDLAARRRRATPTGPQRGELRAA